MKPIAFFALIGALALLPTHGVAAPETFSVAPNDCVIVIPNEANAHAQQAIEQAAEELRDHLKLIMGTKIPIQKENAAEGTKGKFVWAVGVPPDGAPPLAREEARWVVTRKGVHLYGDAYPFRGVAFAVYDFLEEQLGVRWVRPAAEFVSYQPRSTLTLTAGRHEWKPSLEMRKIRTYIRPGRGYDTKIKEYVAEFERFLWSNEQHDAVAHDVARWQNRMRMGSHTQIHYGHAFTDWWNKYSKTHPDYFALNRWGRREPETRTPPKENSTEWSDREIQGVKLCVSNPAVAEQIVQNWLSAGGRKPWVNACMNDFTMGFCRCPNCLKLDGRKEGEELGDYLTGLTDRYVFLANQVARLARQHDPKAGAVMYAYETTEAPPRIQRVEPNVMVAIVPTMLELQELDQLFRKWKEAGATQFYMRPNYPVYYNTLALPLGHEKQMYDAFQVAYQHGVVAVDYDSLTGLCPYTGMADYITARTFSDPSKPFAYWEDHYCAAYGPAAEDIKAYHRYWREEFWEKRIQPNLTKIVTFGKSHNFARGLMWTLGDYYRLSDFDATDAILKKAAARKLAEPQRKLVEELVLAHRGARLLVAAVTTPGADKFAHSLRLIEFREQHHRPGVFNWLSAYASESRFGDASGAKIAYRLRTYPLPWIATGLAWWFKLDPNDVGLKEKWQEKPWAEVSKWDLLRTDFYWDNPYRSETDPALVEKVVNYDGVAWYAVRQTIPTEMKGRKILLYFGAVGGSCQVYVNGKLAGTHPSQKPGDKHESFTIRIDEFVDWERTEQTITVRIEDRSELGGIGKRVWLVSQK